MRFSIAAGFALLLAGLALAPTSEGADAYHGTVLDAETKAPLEGAVVTVVWHRKPAVTMDGPQYFHRAREVLTDSAGKFSVSASPGIDWNPLTYVVKEPRIVIYKPGYGPFPVAHGSPRVVERFGRMHQLDLAELNAELLRGAVVELPPLKTQEEQARFTTPGELWLSIEPYDRIPNLIRLINIQRKRLHLDPYPASGQEG